MRVEHVSTLTESGPNTGQSIAKYHKDVKEVINQIDELVNNLM